MLGRMSDFDGDVREIVSRTFAILMTLMPLESGVPNPPGMSTAMVAQKQKDRRFLDQLMDSSKLEHYTLPTRITATLRSYQQDGLNWMKFLNTYQVPSDPHLPLKWSYSRMLWAIGGRETKY